MFGEAWVGLTVDVLARNVRCGYDATWIRKLTHGTGNVCLMRRLWVRKFSRKEHYRMCSDESSLVFEWRASCRFLIERDVVVLPEIT